MSTTIATAAGTGLGSARQVVYAKNAGLWWAFGFTGTNTLASWYSADNSTWTAGATHTLAHNHASEARNLQVAYKLIGSLDVVQVVYEIDVNGAPAVFTLRASISSTTLTWHSSETTIGSTFFTITAPAYSSGAVVFDSTNRVVVVNGALVDQDVDYVRSSGSDPGTGEQAMPVSWGSVTTIDSSPTNEVKSAYAIDTAAITSTNHLALVADNGSGDASCTALRFATYDGSAWSAVTNNASGGTFGAIDKNDWGAVEYNGTLHVVWRSGASSFSHRTWDGVSWAAGSSIPAQASLAGGGVALASDGQSVWLVVIDSGAGSHIRYIQWSPASLNGVADAWGTWQDVESVTSSPAMVGCARDAANGVLLVYWTEGTTVVAAAPLAPPPPDPPGQIFRDIVVAAIIGTASSATQTVTFTGTQPTPGVHKILVTFAASFTTTPSITSVKDNATDVAGGHSFTAAVSRVRAAAQGVWEYYLDLPTGAVWSGNYQVTITYSAAVPEASQGAVAYRGIQPGGPAGTNNNGGAGTAASTGAATPGATPATYTGGLTTNSGNNPATFTWAAPFLEQASQKNGASGQVLSIADALNDTGAASRNAAITVDSTNWDGVIAVWLGLPTGQGPAPQPFTPAPGPLNPQFMTWWQAWPGPAVVAPPAGPFAAGGRLRATLSTPRGRARIAGPAAPAAGPMRVAERLVAAPRPLPGRAAAAGPAPAAARPTSARERLVAVVTAPRSRARLAGAGPLAQPAAVARQLLKRVVVGLRGRGGAAPTVSRAPMPARQVLRRVVQLLRGGRGAPAGAAPQPARSTSAAGRLVRTAQALRARATIGTRLIVSLPPAARGLARIVSTPRGRAATARPAALAAASIRARGRAGALATPRGRALTARPAPPGARPFVARGRQRGPIAVLRGALARVVAIFTGPPPPAIAVALTSRTGAAALSSHGSASLTSRTAASNATSRSGVAALGARDAAAALISH